MAQYEKDEQGRWLVPGAHGGLLTLPAETPEADIAVIAEWGEATKGSPTVLPPDPARPANVIQAIARIMAEMPAVGKNQKMESSSGNYNYRGIEDVTAAIQKLMGKYGVVPSPRPTNYSVTELTTRSGGTQTETRMDVFYVLRGPAWQPGVADKLNDQIEVGPYYCIARDSGDKGTNKAMTMALKQMLVQEFVIGEGSHDPDSYVSQDRAPGQPEQKLTPEEWAEAKGWLGVDAMEHAKEATRAALRARAEEPDGMSASTAAELWRAYQRPDGPDGNPRPRSLDEHEAFWREHLEDGADNPLDPPRPDGPPASPGSAEPAAGADEAQPAPEAPPEAQEAAQAGPGQHRDKWDAMYREHGIEHLLEQLKLATSFEVAKGLADRGAAPATGTRDEVREQLGGLVIAAERADAAEARFLADTAPAVPAPPPAEPAPLGRTPEQEQIIQDELARQEKARAKRRGPADNG